MTILRERSTKMKIKSTCIVGVDGTGKSSTIEQLKERLGEENVVVQYMGARMWETKLAQKYIGTEGRENLFRSIMIVTAFPMEMFHRVYKHRGTNKIVIFDRYVYEQIVVRKAKGGGLFNKIVTSIYSILFNRVMYKPGLTAYLKCPIETSLARKNDIQTREELDNLKRNKCVLDKYYTECKGTIVIDTSETSQNDVVNTILKAMKNRGIL